MYPEELRYTKEHEWAKREAGRIRIGITQFAADRLSDIVFIELPQPGTALTRLQPFGVIESVKAVSDLYAPVSGTVVEANSVLANHPDLVNTDPYREGWMLVVDPTDPSEFDQLLSSADYRRIVGDGQ